MIHVHVRRIYTLSIEYIMTMVDAWDLHRFKCTNDNMCMSGVSHI